MRNSVPNPERDVIEVLRRRGGAVETHELLRICFTDLSTLKQLEKLGHIEFKEGGVWLARPKI